MHDHIRDDVERPCAGVHLLGDDLVLVGDALREAEILPERSATQLRPGDDVRHRPGMCGERGAQPLRGGGRGYPGLHATGEVRISLRACAHVGSGDEIASGPFECVRHPGEGVRPQFVVAVEEAEVGGVHQGETGIAGGAEATGGVMADRRETSVSGGRVIEDRARLVGRTVVDQDRPPAGFGLCAERVERSGGEGGDVASGDDQRHDRGGGSHVPSLWPGISPGPRARIPRRAPPGARERPWPAPRDRT